MAFPIEKLGSRLWRATTETQRDLIGGNEGLAVGDSCFVDGLGFFVAETVQPTASSWRVLGSAGWQTIVDEDYTQLPTQTLSTGANTVNGKTLTLTPSIASGAIGATGLSLTANAGAVNGVAGYRIRDFLPEFDSSNDVRVTLRYALSLWSTEIPANWAKSGAALVSSATPESAENQLATIVYNNGIKVTLQAGAWFNGTMQAHDDRAIIRGVFSSGNVSLFQAAATGSAGSMPDTLDFDFMLRREMTDRSDFNGYGSDLLAGIYVDASGWGVPNTMTIERVVIEARA